MLFAAGAWALSLPGGLWVVAMSLDANAVEGLVNGDVQRAVIVSHAEFHIAGDAAPILEEPFLVGRPGRNESQLLARGIDDHDSGLGQAADSHVDIALGVDAHPVTAIFLTKVHEGFALPLNEAVLVEGEGINLHRAAFGLRIARRQPVAAVVVVDQIECFLIGGQRQTVGLFHVVCDFDHSAILVQPIDRLLVQPPEVRCRHSADR